MIIDWYKNTIIENIIPDFRSTNIKEIKSIYYYKDYNEFYEEVSFLNFELIVDYNSKKYILTMKFDEISSMYLSELGGGYNQLMGFSIQDLSGRGIEKSKRFFVEDYENQTIKFYCSSFKIVSLLKDKC